MQVTPDDWKVLDCVDVQMVRFGNEPEPYFKEVLSDGLCLSSLILQKKNFANAEYWTRLPLNADLNRSTEFRCGGILPMNPRVFSHTDEKGKNWMVAPTATTDLMAAKIIHQYLLGAVGRVCLIEDNNSRPDDLHLKRAPAKFMEYGGQIYYVLAGDVKVEIIEQTIKKARSWRLVGVLSHCELASSVLTKDSFAQSELEEIAEKSEACFIDAYDSEAALFATFMPMSGGTRLATPIRKA